MSDDKHKATRRTFLSSLYSNDMAEDIVALMNCVKIEHAHIVGISMGGQIAQIFAIEHPEKLLSLTCIATTSGDPGLPPPNPQVLIFPSPQVILLQLSLWLLAMLLNIDL